MAPARSHEIHTVALRFGRGSPRMAYMGRDMMRLLFTLVLAAGLAGLQSATAQVYPARPITMVVPLAPGGSTDVIGRIMAEAMRAWLGQPVIVENTAGAGGTIGVGRV